MPEIQLPLKIEKSEGAKFCHLVDASGQVVCGGMTQEHAQFFVDLANAQPRKKSRKVQIEEQLKASDVTARLAGRDNIIYGTHDTIPGGDHVLKLGSARRRG